VRLLATPLAQRFPARARHEKGIATVEAAIALPLLLLLMLAGVEVTRAFVQYTVLSNTVRNAARHVAGHALLGTTQTVSISAALLTETRNLAVYGNEAGTGTARLPGLATDQVSVTDAGNNNVAVAAVYPFQPLFGAQLPTFGASGTPVTTAFNMTITVTMRAL
jgi:Flp pilus assembly protein TadG